jgi:hypothetical protein
MRRVREDSLDDSFREPSRPLILLFHYPHFHAGFNLRSTLSIHIL